MNHQNTIYLFFLQLIYLWYKEAKSELKRCMICLSKALCQAVLVWCCWPHMKEMKSSHKTGGLLTPRGPVCWCYTHTHTHARTHGNRTAPVLCQQVTRWPICFAPLPSGKPGLVVPTDRQPNSPHASWQAGTVTAPLVEDQMLIATRSCCSAATRPPRKDCLSL